MTVDLWGSGQDLGPVAMSVRAATMFALMLVLVRVGGVRIFGKRSAFDNVVVIILGAVAARGVVGASPFWSTVAASAVIVVVHRILGFAAVRSRVFDQLLNGRAVPLCRDGRIDRGALSETMISEDDLMESLRLETKKNTLERVHAAQLERNGRISFLVRDAD